MDIENENNKNEYYSFRTIAQISTTFHKCNLKIVDQYYDLIKLILNSNQQINDNSIQLDLIQDYILQNLQFLEKSKQNYSLYKCAFVQDNWCKLGDKICSHFNKKTHSDYKIKKKTSNIQELNQKNQPVKSQKIIIHDDNIIQLFHQLIKDIMNENQTENFQNIENFYKIKQQLQIISSGEEYSSNISNHYLQNYIYKNVSENIQINSQKIKCHLCKKNGKLKYNGRLIQFDSNKWVHINCALWTNGVEYNEQEITNFNACIDKMKNQVCKKCQQKYATLECLDCKQNFHFPCFFESKGLFFKDRKIICNNCNMKHNGDLILNLEQLNTEGRFVLRRPLSNYNASYYYKIGSFNLINICNIKNLSDDSIKDNEPNLTFSNYKIIRNLPNQNSMFIEIQIEQKDNAFGVRAYCVPTKKIQDFLHIKENQSDFIIDRLAEEEFQLQNEMFVIETSKSSEPDNTNILNTQIVQNTQIVETQFAYGEQVGQIWDFFKNKLQNDYFKQNQQDIQNIYEFLGLNIPNVRYWCQNFKTNSNIHDSSFSNSFYGLDKFTKTYYDSMSQFEKQTSFHSLHDKIIKNPRPFKNRDYTDLLYFHDQKQKISFKSVNKTQKSEYIDSMDLIKEYENNFIVDEKAIKIAENKKNLKLQKQIQDTSLQKRHDSVYVGPSKIHKYGLYAREKFRKDTIVAEYIGQYIRNSVADQREKTYEIEGFGDCYMFRVSKTHVIDATFIGNQSRYANHSCDPNCKAVILDTKQGDPRIVIFAIKDIEPLEELTYDYNFETESEKIICGCGAKNCQGRLN